MDRTVTGAGARELAGRLSSPLAIPTRSTRGSMPSRFLIERETLRDDLRAALKSAPDIARAMPRLGFGRGGPRDLAAVRDAISRRRAR